MSTDKKHIAYSAADIDAYLKGALTDAEMHAMEKAALEDPFLADALDGYQGTPVHFEDTSRQLQQSLSKRIRSEDAGIKRFPVWMQYAALVAGITLTFLAIRLLTTTPEKIEIVQQPRASSPVADTEAAATAPDSGLVAFQAPKQADKSSVSRSAGQRKKEFSIDEKGNEPATETIVAPSPVKAFADQEFEETKQMASEISTVKAAPAEVVQGIVLDQNHQPIPGAVVQLPTARVVTDPAGRFDFVKADTPMVVEVRSVGFSVARTTVHPGNKQDTIVLMPVDMALNEVVVVGYGTSKNKSKTKAQRTTAMRPIAEPDVSWEEYNDYITDNLDDLDVDEGAATEMIVSFMVSKDGGLSQFKVERPVASESLTAKAKQLINNGPKWKVNGGDSAKATVVLKLGRKK